MVKCDDWEEFEWFLDTYCNFSCLNCVYGGKDGKPSQFLLCKYGLDMMDLSKITLCVQWKSDKGKSLEDYIDCPIWSLPDEIVDKLNNDEMTIKDLRTYGVNYE